MLTTRKTFSQTLLPLLSLTHSSFDPLSPLPTSFPCSGQCQLRHHPLRMFGGGAGEVKIKLLVRKGAVAH